MISQNQCTGCGACASVCPLNCISMKLNRLGEWVPTINKNKCINCHLCEKTCPQNEKPEMFYPISCYAAWSKNKTDYFYSASGGVASVFSRFFLNNRNVVYGCDYDSNANLFHFRVSDEHDLERIRTSKYSQSQAFLCFKNIKEDLENNRKVLFIGTPCQVAGLKRFLRYEYETLFTIDLVCHGTPPNIYLQTYLKDINQLPLTKIRFRGEFDKKITIWKSEQITYQASKDEDLYFSAFYKNIISRNSCYYCQYANSRRIADITLGDFWGLGKLKKAEKVTERPSLVLINTEKGSMFFDDIKKDLIFEERTVDEGISGNGRLNNPPGLNEYSTVFKKLYPFLGFKKSVLLSQNPGILRFFSYLEKYFH